MSKRRTGTPEVHTITSTAQPLGDDIARRAKRYLFQMMLRTLCFLGAVITWGRVPTWLSVALLVGAVVLPYVAVVLANAGRERPERAEDFSPTLELGGVPSAPGARATAPYAATSPFEPSTFPVVDPFGPGADLPVTDPRRGFGPGFGPGRSGWDGADETGRRSA